MSFAHTWFLLGLGAAAVPIILHFLRHQRVRRAYFSSLALLMLVHRQRSVRLAITQLFLLLARITLVVALTFAFAQPMFTSPRLAGLNPGPRLVAIIWDNAMAMGAGEPPGKGPPLAEQARHRLERIVGRLAPTDSLWVITTAPTPSIAFQGTRRELDTAKLPGPSHGAPDMPRALARAAQVLSTKAASERVLVIVSDFRRGPFLAQGMPALPPARTILVPVGLAAPANWGVVGLGADPPTVVAGEETTITARLATRGVKEGATGAISLSIDGQAVERRTVVAAEGGVRTQFKWRARGAGHHRVAVTLGDDVLPGDNLRETIVGVLPHRKVLLVNGRKRAIPAQDEGYFLRRLLGTPDRPRPGTVTREVTTWPPQEALADLDLIILANVSQVPPAAQAQLERILRRGGTVLAFLGDQVDVDSYAKTLLPLASLRLERRAETPASWRAAEIAPGPLDFLFEEKYWQGVKSESYHLVKTLPQAGHARVPVVLEDGTPAIVLAAIGTGTLILVNSSATTATSDLPLHPIFPVLAFEAARLSAAQAPTTVTVGSSVPLELDPSDPGASIVVQGPDGRIHSLRAVRAGPTVAARFDQTLVPGLYEVMRRGADARRAEFVVVTPPESESDLTPIPVPELGRRFPGAVVLGAQAGGPPAPERDVPLSTVSVTEILLLVAALAMLAEMALLVDLERQISATPGAP